MKTLVVYGTKSGCTEGIAQRIGERIAAGGSAVEVFPAEKAPDPAGYDAVVVGSGVRAGHWHAPVEAWVEANAQALKERPVAFYTCGLMITQEGKADEVRAYTDPIDRGNGHRTRSTSVCSQARSSPRSSRSPSARFSS